MQSIHGRHLSTVDGAQFVARAAAATRVLLDIGTGDGRFVVEAARRDPGCLALGIDACRENLRAASRSAPPNALFVIANARALPAELRGCAAEITINFPWGSLLTGLLRTDPALLDGLRMIARPGAALDVRLNSSACAEAGVTLDDGGSLARRSLLEAGFVVGPPAALDGRALRSCPTTWAKRLAYGRDPHARFLRAIWPATQAERRWSAEQR